MQPIRRREFLGMVGTGSAAAAAAAVVPGAALLAGGAAQTVAFHGESGLPARPWPAYATAVVSGSVDLRSGTGLMTSRLLAGQPGNANDIGLPGTIRVVRITRAREAGRQIHLQGVVEDRSSLRPGESAHVTAVIDRSARQLHTTVMGSALSLALS